jgi:hypothetical protein
MVKNFFISFFLLAMPIFLTAQDSTISDTNNLPTLLDPPIVTYFKKGSNILDSFKTDSLREILWGPFKFPGIEKQLPTDGSYEKLDYNQIVKYKRVNPNKPWFLISFLSILGLLLAIKLSYLKQVLGLIKAPFNKTYFREHLDSLQTDLSTFNFLQILLKSAVFTQLLYLCINPNLNYLIKTDSTGINFFILLGIVFTYFSLEKVLRNVFSNLTLISQFNKNVFLLQSSVDIIFVLLLFPILIFYYYFDGNKIDSIQLQGLATLVISFYFITRTLISLILNKEARTIHKFLIITYLCTFEIFPFLIWVKVIRI